MYVHSIKITKAWYCTSRNASDMYSDGTLKMQEGWVVTGFLDFYEAYCIPKTYQGLPIIGILYTAYEAIQSYKVEIHFDSDMLFVFPPRNGITPTYIVDDSSDNRANMYGAAYFSYRRGAGVDNLVTQLMKYKNMPYKYGYTSLGRCKEAWRDNGSIYNLTITLRQASEKTYESCYRPVRSERFLNSIPDRYSDLWRTSWYALKVGKYYSLGKHDSWSGEHKKFFDDHECVLAFVWQPVNEDISCAFNLIGGTETII